MSDPAIDLSPEQARQNIREAQLPEQEARLYSAFVDHFPEALFFANTEEAMADYQEGQGVTLPSWFLQYRLTLAEAYAGADDLAIQFSSFTDAFHVGSPRRKKLDRLWYTLSLPGLPRGKKQRNIYLKGSSELQLFPIAVDIEDDRYQLGINLNETDTRIYEYHVEDIEAAFAAKEDIAISVMPVFASPGDMLSRIARIQHEGQVTSRKEDTPTHLE